MLPTLLILSAILLLALVPTLYVRYVLCRQCTSRWRSICWLPFTILVVVLVLTAWLIHSAVFLRIFTFLITCIVLPALVLTFISGIGWLFRRKWPKVFRWATITGYIFGGIVCLMMVYSVFWGWKNLTVKYVDIYFDDLPETFEGYRIAQLSDLHVGAYGDQTAFIEKVVEQTNALQPDMIVFTGDIVNLSSDEIRPFEPVLSRLTATDGVYSVLGNHDYCKYGFFKEERHQQDDLLQVQEAERRIGWHLLVDEHQFIHRGSDSIAIIGVGNISEPPYLHAGDLHKAVEGLSDSVFSILLSHDPDHWRMEVLDQTQLPLMLSGHTHAGQFKIGSLSPAAMMYKEWSGLYEEGHQRYLMVSEGVGGTFSFRFGATPQIVVITLHGKKV